MSVSHRISKRREELGFSQTELAKRAGLKPPAISQYESGVRNPSYEALIKLSNALDVSTDFLISGKEINSDIINDKTVKVLLKIMNVFNISQKEKLLEYAKFIAKTYKEDDIPIFNEPTDYANFILKKYFNESLPVDVITIVKNLGISIYEDYLNNGEGILLNGEKKVIILNKNTENKQRKKFTLAILLGHAIIPWHIKSTYEIRKNGSSTLLTENIEEMEAQNFAASLIMPSQHIQKDFNKISVSLENLKKLALNKYDVSLFSLLNQLVTSEKDTYSVIQSENWNIIKTYSGSRPLVEKISPKSIASSFFSNPSKSEETREGIIPADSWLLDSKSIETVKEESIYNPEYGKVLTLLTFNASDKKLDKR